MERHPEASSAKTEQFSLFTGGPIYQHLLRAGTVKPPWDRARRRILAISMLAWAPLLVLTVLSGRLLGGVKIPFLYDYEVHIRLLAILPLLIAAEVIIHRRMKVILGQFQGRQVVTDALRARFEAILDSALRLRNSMAVELALIVFVLLAGGFLWRALAGLQSDTYYATITSGGTVKTLPATGTSSSVSLFANSSHCVGISGSASGRDSFGRFPDLN